MVSRSNVKWWFKEQNKLDITGQSKEIKLRYLLPTLYLSHINRFRDSVTKNIMMQAISESK